VLQLTSNIAMEYIKALKDQNEASEAFLFIRSPLICGEVPLKTCREMF